MYRPYALHFPKICLADRRYRPTIERTYSEWPKESNHAKKFVCVTKALVATFYRILLIFDHFDYVRISLRSYITGAVSFRLIAFRLFSFSLIAPTVWSTAEPQPKSN